MALTKGITLGTGRPASLDIIASAWLDMDVSLAGQGTVTMAKHLLTKCFNKVSQKANLHLLARARTYVSLKVSLTHIRIASRPVETELFVPPEIVGRVLPHIVVRFQLNLNSELTSLALDKLSLSDCHVDVLGVAVFSYCNLLQRVVLNQGRQALRQALPLSSGRAMRLTFSQVSLFVSLFLSPILAFSGRLSALSTAGRTQFPNFTLYCFLFLDLGTKSTSRSTLMITALSSPS